MGRNDQVSQMARAPIASLKSFKIREEVFEAIWYCEFGEFGTASLGVVWMKPGMLSGITWLG